jgi:hypothetical protein
MGRITGLGSVGTPLQLPCCFKSILDGTGVASCEISHNHHVLDVPGRHAKGFGELPQYRIAILKIGADHHVSVVKLARDQPAVIPPLGQPLRRGLAHTGQGPGQPSYITDLH